MKYHIFLQEEKQSVTFITYWVIMVIALFYFYEKKQKKYAAYTDVYPGVCSVQSDGIDGKFTKIFQGILLTLFMLH